MGAGFGAHFFGWHISPVHCSRLSLDLRRSGDAEEVTCPDDDLMVRRASQGVHVFAPKDGTQYQSAAV